MKEILFVDDEPEFVRPQVDALESAGYKVVKCRDADEAMIYLKKNKPALIILDLIMPPGEDEMPEDDEDVDFAETGIKLHRNIRQEFGLTDVPIVFLSVVRDREIRREIGQLERAYNHDLSFLHKPVSSSDVVAAVQSALGESLDTM